MGFLARAVAERKNVSADQLWSVLLGAGYASKAGPSVTLNNALKVATAFACMKVLSQGCAQVPFKLFQEKRVDGLVKIEPARDHSLYDVLTVRPNDWTTSFEFRETLVLHAAMGNAYVFKNVVRGKIIELILLNPGRVEKFQRDDWSIYYKVTSKSGEVMEFPAETIWHVRGPSWDGYLGLDVMQLAREALGLSIATEETHARLHAKGVRPSGTYSVDGPLNADQYRTLKSWIDKEFAGAENSGSPMILDRGAKWLSQAMTGLDAQHLETRRFQIEEVCRFFGVMPIMVGYSDKATTYASSEQMFIAHVVHTLSPWFARIEQSADAFLLTKAERAQGFYFKFMAAGLLRGASAERGEYFARALGSGGSTPWMTQDEVRALDELNPFGGDAGVLHQPPVAAAPAAPTPDPAAKKSFEVLETKLSDLLARPAPAASAPSIHVTLNQEPVTVKVDPSAVTVNHTAEVKAAAPAPAPNVHVDVHVPQAPAPTVNNVVNVEKQDLPNVTLEATLPPLTVTAVLPARKTHTETTVIRDKDGQIIGSAADGTETDA
jgi:HK97 family phage portal protein